MKKIILSLVMLSSAVVYSQDIKLVSWNVESGGASLDTIAEQLTNDFSAVDFFCLVEVPSGALDKYAEAVAKDESANYGHVFTESGGEDRMMIVYNKDKFDLDSSWELIDIRLVTLRPMLIGQFTDKSNNQTIHVGVNHLARAQNEPFLRHAQSRALNKWFYKSPQKKGVILLAGDYNYDWDIKKGDKKHDDGYDILTKGDRVKWVRPTELVTTQCSSKNGSACWFNSVLDFVFVNEMAQELFSSMSSEIIVRDGDFPPNEYTADHRPIIAEFTY